jgi:HPt (histidine-containing phosphotransfer) domain-containing protein
VGATAEQEIRFHAHAVKGSAGTLQAKRLQAASLALELLGQKGCTGEIAGRALNDQAEQLLADVKREHAALVDYLRERGIEV